MKQVTFRYGDNSLPGVVMAGGSQQTAIGASVLAAERVLAAELLKLARDDSPLADLSVDEVQGIDGELDAINDQTRHESYASILTRAQRETLAIEAEPPMPLETQH